MGLNLMVELGGIRLYADPSHNGWGVLKDGIDGWWDSLDTRDELDTIPGADGAFEPGEPLVDPRLVTIRGAHVASSPEWSIQHTRNALAALAKKSDLDFRLWEAGEWRRLRNARLRGRAKVAERRRNVIVFELTVRTADPRKYGESRQIHMDALVESTGGMVFPIVDGAVSFGGTGGVLFPGVFALSNPGTAEFFPEAFTITGPMAGFTIQSEQWVIEYDGTIGVGEQLIVTPYAGGRAVLSGADVSHNLLRAEWVPVSPGTTRGYLFTPTVPGSGSGITIDYPEGAWL